MIVATVRCFIISPSSTFQTATNFSNWIFDAVYEFGIILALFGIIRYPICLQYII